MAVLKPRERLVYFRISEDEYRQFTSVCEQAGARSVSDLARNAVQRLIADGQRHEEENQMVEKLRVLERLIGEVKAQLQLLSVNPANEGHIVAAPDGANGSLSNGDSANLQGQGE